MTTTKISKSDTKIFKINKRLGRGINLGASLEGPYEGAYGFKLKASYFKMIKEQGFDSVRIPVSWGFHAAKQIPHKIDPKFMDRVDWAVNEALENELAVVLNFHHFDEINKNPVVTLSKFLAIWSQIANYFISYPENLVFEILNEPHDNLDAKIWNQFHREARKIIRMSNPSRALMIDSARWGIYEAIPDLVLPEKDRNIIASFHYYLPFQFTHQGASWAKNSKQWLGTQWTGTDQEKQDIMNHFDLVSNWGIKNKRPIYLGEFGAYEKADMDSRIRWTRFVVEEATRRNMPWAYWEFCHGFGIYDRKKKEFREPLLRTLIR